LHDWACRLFGAEVFVKGDDTMNFRNCDIEYVSENRNQIFADISGVMLHGMERWQHATFNASELADNGFEFGE
jgi:hypothetical protein